MEDECNGEFIARLDAALPLMLAEIIELSAGGDTDKAHSSADTLVRIISNAINPSKVSEMSLDH